VARVTDKVKRWRARVGRLARRDAATRGAGARALAATMIVDTLMAMAPTALGRSIPLGLRTPIAMGMATRL